MVKCTMKIYRLYTQNKHYRWLCQLVAANFDGFTIQKQTGYWQNKAEKSLCVEIIDGSNSAPFRIKRMCQAICGYNKQQCVMVVEIEAKSVQFISAGD